MQGYDLTTRAVTTDVVIFTIRDKVLKLLLVKRRDEPYRGLWALPGSFAQPEEDLEQCARRGLQEKTGLTGVYLEQLYTFGRPDRDPRGRVVSVAYSAMIPSDKLALHSDSQEVDWIALNDLPPLAFDHAQIVAQAHQRLAAKVDYSTIAFQFMPKKFTLSELQGVYEIILGEKLDKRNFRKRVLGLGRLEELDEERRNGAHRPAKLYRVKHPGRVEIIK